MIRISRRFAVSLAAGGILMLGGLWVVQSAAGGPRLNGPESITVEASGILWNPEDRTEDRTGSLKIKRVLELTSEAPAFGGISSLALAPDGKHFLGISDNGIWIEGVLTFDQRGRVSGMDRVKMSPILDADGNTLDTITHWDSESLAVLSPAANGEPFGKVAVGFERNQRIWIYDLGAQGLSARPEPLNVKLPWDKFENNGGLESLVALPGNRLLAITEDAPEGEENPTAFLIDLDTLDVSTLHIAYDAPYSITDARLLPDGDLILLERRFSPIGGVGMQMRRIDSGQVRSGAVLTGTTLIDVGNSYSIDNMEALAVRTGEDGTELIVMSDDNFSGLQRTLILQAVLE